MWTRRRCSGTSQLIGEQDVKRENDFSNEAEADIVNKHTANSAFITA